MTKVLPRATASSTSRTHIRIPKPAWSSSASSLLAPLDHGPYRPVSSPVLRGSRKQNRIWPRKRKRTTCHALQRHRNLLARMACRWRIPVKNTARLICILFDYIGSLCPLVLQTTRNNIGRLLCHHVFVRRDGSESARDPEGTQSASTKRRPAVPRTRKPESKTAYWVRRPCRWGPGRWRHGDPRCRILDVIRQSGPPRWSRLDREELGVKGGWTCWLVKKLMDKD